MIKYIEFGYLIEEAGADETEQRRIFSGGAADCGGDPGSSHGSDLPRPHCDQQEFEDAGAG